MSIRWDTSDFHPERPLDAMRPVMPAAVMQAAEFIKGVAQSKTPVETGNLRSEADARPAGDLEAEVYFPGPY